jgi:threonine dehydrogenase-like Zn-dependent dehydrogenase
MKAVVLTSQRQHELQDVPEPEPGSGEALVRSQFCGICGSDLHAPELIDLFRSGVVSGHEFAGEIVAVGWASSAAATSRRNRSLPTRQWSISRWFVTGFPQGGDGG